MKIEFSRAVNYKDSELSAVEMDLESLTGNDLIAVEENFRRKYPNGQLWGTAYAGYIAAKSAHVPAEVILNLPVNDYFKIVNAVWDFFGGINSKESQPQNTGE